MWSRHSRRTGRLVHRQGQVVERLYAPVERVQPALLKDGHEGFVVSATADGVDGGWAGRVELGHQVLLAVRPPGRRLCPFILGTNGPIARKYKWVENKSRAG